MSRINGLHPTSVMVPPRIAQKPMGISISDSEIFMVLLTLLMAGRNKAAAPMFCIKLEIPATVTPIAITTRDELFPAILTTGLTIRLMRAVLSNPAPMMITAMMEITALLLNPEKASLGVTK